MEGPVGQQRGHERALTAAEVGDRGRVRRPQGGEDGAATLLGEGNRPVGFGADSAHFRRRSGVVETLGVGVVHLGEPGQGCARQDLAMREVSAGDELSIRMRSEPSGTGADELVDLVRADPVMLGVVEHGQQDVEMIERGGERHRAGQRELYVT